MMHKNKRGLPQIPVTDTSHDEAIKKAAEMSADFFIVSLFSAVLGGAFWLSLFIDAYVFTRLWKWFVVPPFSAPILGYAQAAGLLLLIEYVAKFKPTARTKEEEVLGKYDLDVVLAKAFVLPFLILLLGYIIHLCV